MMTNVIWERSGNLQIAIVEGRLDSNTTLSYESELLSGISEHDYNLVLDFNSLSYINSTGLRMVMKIAKQFIDSDKKFGICSLNDSVDEIFEISGLGSSINKYSSKAKAIKELGND